MPHPAPSDDHGGHLPYLGPCLARFKVSLLVEVSPPGLLNSVGWLRGAFSFFGHLFLAKTLS